MMGCAIGSTQIYYPYLESFSMKENVWSGNVVNLEDLITSVLESFWTSFSFPLCTSTCLKISNERSAAGVVKESVGNH